MAFKKILAIKYRHNIQSIINKNLLSSIALFLATLTTPTLSKAEIEATMGAGSNYIYRGQTVNNNLPYLNAGLAYKSSSGLYVGALAHTLSHTTNATNTPSTETNIEVILSSGISRSNKTFSYDLGYMYYSYPKQKNLDSSEVYIESSNKKLLLGASMTTKEPGKNSTVGDIYWFASYGTESKNSTGIRITYGNKSYKEKNLKSYSHGQISLSYKGFSFNIDKILKKGEVSQTNLLNDNTVFSINYSYVFNSNKRNLGFNREFEGL